MTENEWKIFFITAIEILGAGDYILSKTPSWCSWITFTRLHEDSGYWTAGLPRREDILDTSIADGGIWKQPFSFSEVAHIILPREFYWESEPGDDWECGTRMQAIDKLSSKLKKIGIVHRVTDLVLEIKLY